MLRDRVRRICGNAQNSDAVFLGGLEVNIVEAGAAQEDQADTAVVQDFKTLNDQLVLSFSSVPRGWVRQKLHEHWQSYSSTTSR
jgi:hypothetical protein